MNNRRDFNNINHAPITNRSLRTFNKLKVVTKFTFISLIIPCTISCNINDSGNYHPNYDNISEIHIINIDGTNHKILTRGWDTKVMKNKNKILFRDYNSSIFTVNYDGTGLTKVRSFQTLWDYALSNDDEKIAVSLFANTSSNLYVMDSDGKNLIQITNEQNGHNMDPHFSADASEIVFRRDWNICKIDANGNNFQCLERHTDSTYLREPYFCNNDKNVLYFEEPNNSTDKFGLHIYDVIDQSDSILLKIKRATSNATLLDFAPNNNFLFIENYMLAEDSIKVMNMMSKTVTNIVAAHYASFSSDGSKIVYTDGKKIYIVTLEGLNEKMIFDEQDQDKWIGKPKLTLADEIVFEVQYSVY